MAQFIWPTLRERELEAVSDEHMRGNTYNVWQQMLTTDWFKQRHPVNPATGADFTEQEMRDGMQRMEAWKPR